MSALSPPELHLKTGTTQSTRSCIKLRPVDAVVARAAFACLCVSVCLVRYSLWRAQSALPHLCDCLTCFLLVQETPQNILVLALVGSWTATPSPLPPSDLPNRPLHDACSGCETHSRAPQCRPHQRARAKLTGAARSDPSSARSLGRERKPSATTMHIRLLSGLHISTTSSSRGQRESSTSRLRSLPKSQPTSGS